MTLMGRSLTTGLVKRETDERGETADLDTGIFLAE